MEIGLLIGTNSRRAIKPREVIPRNDDNPYGIQTALCWGMVGSVTRDPEKTNDDFSVSTLGTVIYSVSFGGPTAIFLSIQSNAV